MPQELFKETVLHNQCKDSETSVLVFLTKYNNHTLSEQISFLTWVEIVFSFLVAK